MKRTLVCLVILSLAAVPVGARTVELALHPAKATESEQRYVLLPRADDQIEADAIPLYQKAIESIPKDFDKEKIRQWLKLPVEQFPQTKAEELVQNHLDSLKLVARAVRCKECNWPDWKPGMQPMNLNKYRELAFIIRLWVRLEISRGQFNGAVVAMQTGFGMAKHLGQAPTIIHGLVGIAAGALMCGEIEQFVQREDSPNLYWALGNLPRPFIDIEKAIENEKKVGLGAVKNKLVRKQLEEQAAPGHDRARMIAKRFDNDLNALQCVEAVRHYAATHDSQLPKVLRDISDIEGPKDLMSGQAFEYRRTAAGAVLQSVVPKDGNERDAIRYEIALKE